MLRESGLAKNQTATCQSQVQRPTAEPPHNTVCSSHHTKHTQTNLPVGVERSVRSPALWNAYGKHLMVDGFAWQEHRLHVVACRSCKATASQKPSDYYDLPQTTQTAKCLQRKRSTSFTPNENGKIVSLWVQQ